MADKSVIIIGAGIAGLAAGVYGQMNGYHTEIFELHEKPGGLCTSWRRQGYTFDGCIHWLMGTAPKSPYYRIWDELGALRDRRMITHEEFTRIQGPDGKALIIYTNLERMEQHLRELGPADGPLIAEYIRNLRTFQKINFTVDKPRELANLLDGVKAGARMLPYLGLFSKAAQTTAGQFAARFKDPFLREAFPMVFGGREVPMIVYYIFLSGMDWGDGGYPEGGSLAFARAIERRYLELGGRIHYGARVAKILLEESTGPDGRPAGKAVGIRLQDKDGQADAEHRADVVISAADGHATLFGMLEGKFVPDVVKGYYRDLDIFKPVVQVSLGIKRDLSHQPHSVQMLLPEPVTVAGEQRSALLFKHYCYDRTLAPAGKSIVEVILDSDHAYWKGLADQDRECYEAEKQQAAEVIISQLERRYPGITADIEVVDVSTPLTTERYTGNWQGSIEGWMVNAKSMKLVQRGMRRTLPGLENFYMIGQWVEPGGGLPGVAPSGRTIIQLLCHRDGKRFVTTRAGVLAVGAPG